MIYGKDTGLLNAFLELLGLAPVCWLCTDNAMLSVVIVNVWGAIGEGIDYLFGRSYRHSA